MTTQKAHLTDESTVQGYAIYPESDRNKYCTECGAKVTLGVHGNEYGHFPKCPHKHRGSTDPRGD